MNRLLPLIVAPTLLVASSALAAPVPLQNATATLSQTISGNFDVTNAIDGVYATGNLGGAEGWAPGSSFTGNQALAETAVFETVNDLGGPGGTQLSFDLFSGGLYGNVGAHLLGHFRLSVTTDDRDAFADGLATGGDVTANWTVLMPTSVSTDATSTLSILSDGSILATAGTASDFETLTVVADTNLSNITGFRLELLENAALPGDGPGQAGNGNLVLREFAVDATPISIPEPASATLAMSAAGLLLLGRRRA